MARNIISSGGVTMWMVTVCMLGALAQISDSAFMPPLRGGSAPCRGVRSYDLAMARGAQYDFTTKATGTLRSQAAEEPPLYVFFALFAFANLARALTCKRVHTLIHISMLAGNHFPQD